MKKVVKKLRLSPFCEKCGKRARRETRVVPDVKLGKRVETVCIGCEKREKALADSVFGNLPNSLLK